jgi:Fe-Mn family superoxide dismutase
MKHILPKLSYAYDALEPHIDARTMEIHYTKHHQTYVDKLNDAIHKPEGEKFHNMPVEELLRNINLIPESIRTAVRNHGGGHANHSLFWEMMTPHAKDKEMKGKVIDAIKNEFESLENFQKKFNEAATNRFGSGWAWLVLHKGKLEVYSTANQDSPLMEGKIPLLGLDVWEHGYYLKWQSNRKGYAENWWNVVNWKKVNELFEKAKK